ncbi:TolC family protein [Deltaproteobacteria bacterium]|nr:TolC family protein [Deltaproteobacteria bacterium]
MKGIPKQPINGESFHRSIRAKMRIRYYLLFISFSALLFIAPGCITASKYRRDADKTAATIINDKQEQLLGNKEAFSIERPSDILRRRLLIEQDLLYSGDVSIGTDKLEPIAHWPEKDYPSAESSSEDDITLESGKELSLTLLQALQVGAMNSPDYQTKKEDVFRSALNLDLQRNEFGIILKGSGESSITADKSGIGDTVEGLEQSGSLSLEKTLKNGTRFATSLAVDLVSLLTQGQTSSRGIVGDASISIPLLRGAGKDIVSEPLTQAERDVAYAIYELERYKKTFAVNVARNYLNVLKQMDQVNNAAENYRNLMASALRIRRLADAGRTTEVEVDQAVQNELNARTRWINTTESYKSLLDSFKKLLGLPTDADIELDRSELDALSVRTSEIVPDIEDSTETDSSLELVGLDRENAGPLEMDESLALKLGLENRLDLGILEGKVYDAQRSVVVKADALGAELTLLGQARLGQSRSIGQTGLEDAELRSDSGIYTGLFTLDLPLERTAERNAYRESLISLERAVRNFQALEDEIKLSIRKRLSDMAKAREGLRTQTRAVAVAEKRVKSTDLFYEAGRAQLRDLLEAQEALLSARNSLTSAVVDYRMAELEFQSDAGILQIDKNGLFKEYVPRGNDNEN